MISDTNVPITVAHQSSEDVMFPKRIHYTILAAAFMVVSAPIPSHVYAQTVKCYFKDCIVYPDGSRICEVKEVPCPNES